MWSKSELKLSKTIFFRLLHLCINPIQEGVLIPKRKIGLLKFYSLSPQNLVIAEPLHCLLTKEWRQSKSKITKTINIKTDFGDIKQMLASGSVLVHYDKYKLLFLLAGVSCYGVASVFCQKMPDGIEKPIAHYARTMTYTLHINWHSSSSYKGAKNSHNHFCQTFKINRVQIPWNILWRFLSKDNHTLLIM